MLRDAMKLALDAKLFADVLRSDTSRSEDHRRRGLMLPANKVESAGDAQSSHLNSSPRSDMVAKGDKTAAMLPGCSR